MTITRVIQQRSTGRYALLCPRPDCEHYHSGIVSEPAARRLASHHDAHHRSQR